MIWLFSRSTVSAFHTCPRYGWYRYLSHGQGLEPIGINEHLLQGTIGHEGLSRLLLGEDPDEVIPHAGKEMKRLLLESSSWHEDLRSDFREVSTSEWQRLTEGLLWAANRWVIPELLKNYKIISVEQSRIYKFPENESIGLLAKPDVLMEPLNDSVPPGVTYLEWKLMTMSKDWDRQYQKNPQAWSGKLAFPEVENFMVVALDKGNVYKGNRNSPFTYLYKFTDDSWSWETERKKGWSKVSTELYPGGMKALVEQMPLELLMEQFSFTQPIPIDPDLMEEWRLGQLREQKSIFSKKAHLEGAYMPGDGSTFGDYDPKKELDIFFPRWLDKCDPPGHLGACSMKRACHGGVDPLGSGFYQVRVPHHELELDLREKGEVL